MTLRRLGSQSDALREATAILAASGIENPRGESRLLLAHALGLSREALLASLDGPVDADAFRALVRRRAAREPIAHITGRREFWSLPFAVSTATLIPRPETETLVEAALAAFPDRRAVRKVLDLGTGTGCLLLALLGEFPAAFGVGVDIVPEAVGLARANAAALGLAGRAAFLCADWAAALQARFDLIVCNPPYIPTGDLAGLEPDVALHEPRSALDGGADGMAACRRVILTLSRLLAPEGRAVVELGVGQADPVAAMARRAGFAVVIRPDLANIPRSLLLSLTEA